MPDNRRLIVNNLLVNIAEELDISPTKYKEAVARYTAVGGHLERGTYPNTCGTPNIYVQGSFRLGTVVRPLRGGKECEYDIDLACELNCTDKVDAANLKKLIGDRLKEDKTYEGMLKPEGRRCWTLIYAESDGVGFHLDALPCAPSPLDCAFGECAIKITDRRGDDTYEFGVSNPKGFADWFRSRQSEVYRVIERMQKQHIVERYSAVYAAVEEVPDELVRTPLQRLVQVLKRHRDARFSGTPNELDRPISVIITTLAGNFYDGERDVFSALENFLEQAEAFLTSPDSFDSEGKWLIRNPAHWEENFAERWNDEGSKKSDAFIEWLAWLREDIDELYNVDNRTDLDKMLRKSFGDKPGGTIANSYKGTLPGQYSSMKVSLSGRPMGNLNFNVPQRRQPTWKPGRSGRVEIVAKYRPSKGGFMRMIPFHSNSTPLPEGCDLEFKALPKGIEGPFKVYWQVVNTGAEATRLNALRGEFYDPDKPSYVRTEKTAYSGMHWVECFVVKDNVCVARSGEFVVNIA